MSSKTAVALEGDGPSPSLILNLMQGITITQGWDVVCAMSVDQINALFSLQYIQNLSQGDTLPPINDRVHIAADIWVQFSGLTLGPPLVSFSPGLEPQELSLSIQFLSGMVSMLQVNGSATTVISIQPISTDLGYSLTGTVPLKSIAGKVQNHHDVSIDILNGKAFAANLQITGGADTLLGAYFLSWLQEHVAQFDYKLGTLVYGNTNLAPAGEFEIATQQDARDSNDKGRVLLFIPTTFNPEGGSQTSLSIPNIIPEGYSATLIVSSQVLFSNILGGFYSQLLANFSVTTTGNQANPGSNYTLEISNGILSIPTIETTYNAGRGNFDTFSGTANAPWEFDKTPVAFPITGIQIEPVGNQLSISCNQSWSQNFASIISVPRTEGWVESGSVELNTSLSGVTKNVVDSVADTISFIGNANVTVSFKQSSIWGDIFGNGDASDYVGGQITTQAQQVLQQIFKVNLPEVNAFAVSNLLFPGMNILSFGAAYVPGDLIVFGSLQAPAVSITPVSASLTSHQTAQFSASNADGSSVKWSALYGTVNADGLYTAPAISSYLLDSVFATSSSNANHQAAAAVNLFPNGVQVSPSFVMIAGNNQPQQFTASSLEAEGVIWSISPKVGSISSAGIYTPPVTVSDEAVTVTATSRSNRNITGSALIVLLTSAPTDVTMTPSFVSVPLTPGATQQFKAVVGQAPHTSITWSVLPAGQGSITSDGLYTAPATINAAQSAVIVATDSISVLFGTALVELAP
jgi:hypothetical protein